MSVGRISNYVLQQTTLKHASQVQETLANLQIQLASGQRSQDFAGMANQTEQFLALENKIAATRVYQDNNKVVESRVNSTSNALDQIITTGTDIKNLILLRRNQPQAVSLPFVQQLDSYYQTIANQLNTNAEGRYIFAGTKTDTKPLDPNSFPSLKEDGTLSQTYYQGSSDDISTKVDDGVNLTLNVRGNDAAFRKIFEGLALAKQADINNSDEDLARAYTLVDEGVKEVTALQTSVNANKVTIAQVTERQTTLLLYWKGLKEEIGNTDLVSVSTEVAINQGILQASFSAFAKINDLKLTDYLR